MPNPMTDIKSLKAHSLAELPRLVACLYADRPILQTAHEYRIGNQGSVSISDGGDYFDHEVGAGGDLLTMIQHALKTDFRGAVVFAQNFLGNKPLPPIPPVNPSHKKPSDYAIKQREKALAMLARSKPIQGTVGEAYFRDKRGITAALPSVLRFVPYAYNFTTGKEHPAMIAPIHNVAGEAIAAHCTFLDPLTGNKIQGKGIRPRLIFGECKGGAIRLSPLKNQVVVCEGVEDGLSILQTMPDACVWVSAGTSGMQNIQLPDGVSEAVIAMDNDPKGAGERAANKLAAQLKKEGRVARIATPAPYKDFNEMLVKGLCHV